MNKVNILVVDDRPEGILSIRAVLNNPDYNLIEASSGNEALKQLLNNDFAVILLDVQMPVMNGFETAALIKTRDSSRDTPIIFMSAINQDEQYVYQGYNVGAVDYLLKPFDPYILRSKVSIFVDIYRKKILIQEQARKIYQHELDTYAQALDKMELDSLRRYQYLADAIPQIVFRLWPDGKYNYFNKVFFEYTGLSNEGDLGFAWKNVIHEDERHLFEELFVLPNPPRTGLEFEGRIKEKDGLFRWHLFRIQPEYYGTEEVSSWLGTATDIEDRKQSEDINRFLSKAGELLVSSLDYETTLKGIAELAVPSLADWCSIYVMKDGGIWKNVTLVHHDPSKLPAVNVFQKIYLANPDSEVGVGEVLRTGKTKVYSRISRQMIEDLAEDEEDRKLAHDLHDKSAIMAPLTTKGHTFGVLAFTFSDSGRRYNDSYIQMTEELSRRCALAYENSRLYKLSQEAIEVRNEFLSIASHELNTPITSLKLHLQMTKRAMSVGQISIDKFSKSIDASVRQVDRLISLIEVLLDVSRIQSGRLTFNFEKFDVVEMVKELKERFKEVLQSNDCSLNVKAPDHLYVSWDRMRIEQVIVNLLTNAIKYAPGKIDLTVKEHNDFVNITIKDYGDGIAVEKMNTIFERFERASSNRSIGGLGLGLFIVKQIIDGHQGTVKVDSGPQKGTSFIVQLPIEVH